MRVQGAWNLMATVLVLSFFTVLLMTGSKVDASTSKNVVMFFFFTQYVIYINDNYFAIIRLSL